MNMQQAEKMHRSGYEPEERVSKPGYVLLIVLTLIGFIVTVVFNVLSDFLFSVGVFEDPPNATSSSSRFVLDISPAPWTFSVWALIYIFQLLWIVYAHTLLCRTNRSRTGLLYYDPPILTATFYVIYLFNLLLNVTFLFTADSEFLAANFVTLIGITLCLYICLLFSFKLLRRYENQLEKSDIIAHVALVQNGLGLYATWTSVASLLTFGIVLHFEAGVTMEITCYIVLAILLAWFLAFFLLELLLVGNGVMRYFVAPYVVVIWALCGSLAANWDGGSGLQVFTLVILIVVILAAVLKVVSIFYRRKLQPLAYEN